MHQPKEFCKELLRKEELDEDIRNNKINQPWNDFRDRITFRVLVDAHAPGYTTLRFPGNYGLPVLTLDEEDLKYLYNKYNEKI